MARRRLTAAQRDALLDTQQRRFEEHPERHEALSWAAVAERLQAATPKILWSLAEMERTGGEPDVIGQDPATGAVEFVDCSAESPAGRRNVCYDWEGQASRKDGLAKANAVDMAAEMGIELLDEAGYRRFQATGSFDRRTSSWLLTPAEIRVRGGAIFGHVRFEHVFICPNGAQSFYSSRGFRGRLLV